MLRWLNDSRSAIVHQIAMATLLAKHHRRAYIMRTECAQELVMSLPEPRLAIRSQRRPTNVSLDRALVEEAKAVGINLSQACERGIADQLAKTKAERWVAENSEALASSNAFVESRELPLAAQRRF